MLKHFDHVTVVVTDVDAAIRFFALLGFEKDKYVVIEKAEAGGVRLRNELMTVHDRRLVFLEGPEGITVELAEWQ